MAARTIGIISDDIYKVTNTIKKHNDQIAELEEKKRLLNVELIDAADKQGLTSGKGKKSSFNISPQVVPQVVDWDAYWEYIHKKRYFHLVQRRPSVKGCQELWELGETIPGTEKFMQVKVNVKGV